MSLPDVRSALPGDITTPHARRVASLLKFADEQLDESVEATIYGSAAVSLYLADEEDFELGYTEDIDIGKMEPDSIVLESSPEVVDPPLEFEEYNVDRWMVHPDWGEEVVSVSSLVDTELLQVQLLHPVDLIITKLERFDSQDVEDGTWLYGRYGFEPEVVCSRLEEAWRTYPTSSHKTAVIEAAFESIFEEECSLK